MLDLENLFFLSYLKNFYSSLRLLLWWAFSQILFCSYRESKMEILTGFYLVSSVVQNITFLLSIYQQYWHFNKLLLCMSSCRKSYFDKLMLMNCESHPYSLVSFFEEIYSNIYNNYCLSVNNNSYINFFLIVFSRQILGF